MFDNITDAERQNNSRTDFEYIEGRKEKFSSQQKFDDQRHLADDDGSQEAPRQTIQYHKGMARENFAQFRAAAILAVVGVGFVASLIMFIVSLLS